MLLTPTNNQPLKKYTVIVTGSSRGIGQSIALAMAQAGANVVITYLPEGEEAKKAESVAQEIETFGVRSLVIAVNIARRNQVEELFTQTMSTFGRIDVLVNNAATFHHKMPLLDLPEAEWERVLSVNLKGTFLCSQAAARQMIEQKSGRIINISSTGADEVFSNMGAYASSKGGINSLSRVLAVELAPYGISVNAIAPGHVDTTANRDFLAEEPMRAERVYGRIPMGRLGYKEEIANLAVFLASDGTGYLTSQILAVDGGITIWQGSID